VSGLTLGLLVGALVAAVVVALFESYRLSLSACQLFLALFGASSRPAGCTATAGPPSKAVLAVDHHGGPPAEQPDVYRSSHGRLLSSPPLARSQADLESAARRLDRVPLLTPVGVIAAIDPSPNFSAFGAGVELGIFTALFTIGSLLVVNWIVKTMRSSNR
jgi:hypothetical protein